MNDTPRSWTLAVDFGTTATVAAISVDGERPLILEIGGERRIPSVVFIDEDGTVVVGQAAAGLAVSRPDRAIRAPKSRLDDQVPLVLGGQPYRATALVTAVLQAVLDEAVQHEGSRPIRTRLTYPATWNRPRRAKLLEAATRAGMPDPVLIAEPVAAALTYAEAAAVPSGQFVAVYDLGGGTFDTAVLQSKTGGFRVVGRPLGDPQLGGELFDEMLMNLVGEKMDPDAWDELLVSDEREWRQAAARLRSECKRVKETLSNHGYGDVVVGLPTGSVEVRVTRSELETLVEPYIDESIDLLARCIADAGVDPSDLTSLYVTGGGSRMPLVETKLREAYPDLDISRRGDPKAAVAFGALVAAPESLDVALAGGAGPTEEESLTPPTDGTAAGGTSAGPAKSATPSMPPASMASEDRSLPTMPPASMASQDRSLPTMPPPGTASQDQSLPPMPGHESQIVGQPPQAPQPHERTAPSATPPPVLPDTVAIPVVRPEPSSAPPPAAQPTPAPQPAPSPQPAPAPQPVAAHAPAAAAPAHAAGAPPTSAAQSEPSLLRNPMVIAAAAITAAVLLILAIVAATRDGDSTAATDTASTVASTTPTTAGDQETTSSAPETTQPTTASTAASAGPSQADLEAVILQQSDVPAGWTSELFVEDDETLCDLPISESRLQANSIFDDPVLGDRVISSAYTYETEQDAIDVIADDRNLLSACPQDTLVLDTGDEITFVLSISPVPEPTLGDESVILQLQTFDASGNLLLTGVFVETRWGRTITQTNLLVQLREFSAEDEQRLLDFQTISYTRSLGIPR